MKNFCFHLNRKAWVTMTLLLCLALPALAQKVTVHGNVSDDTGEALIGATVMEKGTTTGTSTDIDGNYTLTVAPNATLVFSYVGYNPQEIPVGGKTTIDVVLTTNAKTLSETVVIGYGSVKKSDATGSVAVITPDDIEAGIATSTQDLLVGASPGVVVTSDGGNPTGNATIRIRGGSSLSANNNPLIVIDGVPMTDQSAAMGNALTMVNPQNIESMTILKDASATAIYGSRASNGVIIITTKKGRKGRPQVNFAANWHVNTARKTFNMMNAAELTDVVMNQVGTDAAISMLGNSDTNWQKEVLRTSFSQDYSLSVGGSVGVVPYRVNASWTDSQGILKTSDMQRTTVGFNLSPKFFNDALSINANASGTYINGRDADTGAIGGALSFNPTLPVYTNYPIAGSTSSMYNGFTNVILGGGGPEMQASQNPLQILMDREKKNSVYSSNGNLQIDYALYWVPELHFNLNLGYSVSKNNYTETIADNSIQAWRSTDLTNYGVPGAGTRKEWYELQRNTMLSFYINYKKEFEAIKSNLDVMVGYDWQKFDYHGRECTYVNTLGYGYIDDAGNVVPGFSYDNGVYTTSQQDGLNKIGTSVNEAPMTRWANPLQLISFYGRLNYIFDDTYLLTFTLRDDGTSRFAKDHRWGLFPSLALGWKFTNCAFMEGTRGWWNEGKLRLGWGVTGQQDINSYFPYMPIYTLSTTQGFQYVNPYGQWANPDGTAALQPLYPQPYDTSIKWEETTTWNVGLDLGFFNNRLTVAADWYLRNTKDLLARTPVVTLNTANYMTRNIGSLRNTGFEVTLGGKPVVTDNVTWTTSLNMAWNKNEITKLTGDAETDCIANPDRGIPSGTGGDLQWYIVGETANTFRVYQQVYDNDGNPMAGQYVDQNADGVIDDQDLILFHSPDPKMTLTWNNTVTFKNWDFGIVLRANIGNYVYNNPLYERTRLNGVSGYQLSNLMRDEFLFPAFTDNAKAKLSDYFVQNASFLRCDNITVGYTFPDLLNNNLRLRIFGAVQNPFVITKYKGLDPEVFSGIDNNCYPRPITFTLGVVATF